MESSGDNDERKRTTESGSVDPLKVVANLEHTITSLFTYLTSNSPPPPSDGPRTPPRALSDGEAAPPACSPASTPREGDGSSSHGSLKSSRALRLDLTGHRSPPLPPAHPHQPPAGGVFVSLADDAPPPLPRRGPPPFHLSSSSDLSSPSLEKRFCPSAASSAASPPPRLSLASRSSARASPSPSGWASEAPLGARDRKSVSRGSVASKASSDIELVSLGRGERGDAPWPSSPDAEERLRAVPRRTNASPRALDRRNGMLVAAGAGAALEGDGAPAPVGEQNEGRRTPEEYQARIPDAPPASGGGGGRERGRGGSVESPRRPSKEDLAKMAASRLSLQASLRGGRASHDHHYSEIDMYDVEGAPDGGEESTTRTASANTNSSATLPRAPPPVPPHTEGGLLSAGGGVGEPRNNMSRLNGRVHHTGPQHATSAQYQAVPQYHQGAPVQYQGSQGHPEEFEPSCLVRTPSGNVYIPSDMPKTSTLEYKAGLHSPSLHSPVKGDPQKAMEGYNVPFGGGLPAPVLPVRNNLRRPGPGRVGGSSSSAGRGGQGSPHCSWRCTAIIFITIAVVLGAILIYIAATSTLAWSPHGGCAVLVDDASVISDDSHLGQAASRGNPQHRHRGHRGRQGPSQWRPQGPAFVYEVLGEMPWPPEDPPGSPSPSRPLQSRRMRRSVSHDELESQPSPLPPSMDVDSPPPLAPSSSSPSSSSSSSHSPVLTPGSHPPSTTLTHSLPDASLADAPPSPTNSRDSHESPTLAGSDPDVSLSLPPSDSPSNSPSDSPSDSEETGHSHTAFIPSDREADRGEEAPTSASSSSSFPLHVPLAAPGPLTPSMPGDSEGTGSEGGQTGGDPREKSPGSEGRSEEQPPHPVSGSDKVRFVSKEADAVERKAASLPREVYAPVIDVVEYSDADGDDFQPRGVMVSLEDYPADAPLVDGDEEDDDVTYVIEDDNDEAANKTYDEEDGVVEAQPDYIYDHKPEDDYENIVEYEQAEENGTVSGNGEAPPTEIPLAYEAIPSALLATSAEKKASGDRLPVPLDDFDPADIVVEDDTMAGDDLMDRMVGDDSIAAYDLMDRMVGDDPSAYAANGKPKRKLFRSWMAGFPTLETPAGEAEGVDEKDTQKQAPAAPTPAAEALTSTAEPVIGKSMIWRRPMASSVDTWFSRYGRNSTANRDADADETASGDYEDEMQMRITRRSGGRRRGSVQWRSFDPRDPNGGPIPQSDPSHFPSKILESLGVTQRTRDSRNPEPKLAKDLFPHIFEYDLDDHDDYYYDDPVYYYDDTTELDKRYRKTKSRALDDANDEEDTADVILDDDLGEARPGYRDPKSIVTLRPAPVRSQLRPTSAPVSATQYPPGLRVMSLTKEEFHVALPEPRVETLRDGREEVVEIEVVPLSSRDAPRAASSSFHSGPDYSQAHHTRHQTTTTTTTTTTTPTTTTTTTSTTPPPPPPPPLTRYPTESPPLTKPPAKFLPTRPVPEPRQVQFAVAADSASVPRSKQGNIPKFLIHKTEEQYDYLRSAGVVHYHPLTSAPLDYAAAHRPPPLVMTSDQPYAEAEPDRRSYYRDEDLSMTGAATSGAHLPATAHRTRSVQPSQVEASRAEEQPRSHDAAHDQNPIVPSSSKELASDIEVVPRGRSLQAAAKTEERALRSAQHEDASVPEVSPARHPFPPPARNSKRVTVNVTITAEDETKVEAGPSGASKPLYVLSVSVPTSGQDQSADINIVKPDDQEQIATLTVNVRGNTTYDDSTQHETRPEAFQPGVPERLVSHSGRAGQCQCPCPCSAASNSIPIPASFLASAGNKIHDHTQYHKDASDSAPATHDLDSRPPDSSSPDSSSPVPQGCRVDPNPSSTTVPPLSPEVLEELEEHKKRPSKTIPPDGTTFNMMELGDRLEEEIPPYGYWNMQFYQSESAYVKFEVTIPRGSSIGIYGRRNALPTHTSYDFLQVLSGYKTTNSGANSRTTRTSKAPSQLQTVTKYLEQGHWFLSLYNDDGDPQEVSLAGDISTEYTEGCPKGCSGNGDCILGSCQCHPGFAGPDCTQMMCPILCSDHGEYKDGECICRPGWKGRECSIRHDECEVPDCNGHGHCVDGRCRCAKGFKGEFCEEDDCPHPTCSGHGWCVGGTCVCQKGWRGPDCGSTDDAALQCLPDCSGHGQFDLESHQCVCEPEWTGSECSKRVCGLDCGTHGRCEGGACLCSAGWTGDRCDLMTCDPRCEEHGQCKNGTCICMTGWNGRHCTLAGCPGACSKHGSCVIEDEEWKCQCQDGWEGHDCSVKLETQCADNRDNDNDGLVDCADAECCSDPACQHSTLCLTSTDPIDILLRKQPPAVTASFFQRMRFLVEEGSVQSYAKGSAFNESRASVVRGRVISGRGTGLRGVRVSHYRPADTGFTLTRPGGWFDLMVNGGGAVRLIFGKAPFLPVTKTVWVPWNEIVVIDTVVMTTADIVPPPLPTPCPDHNYDDLKPVVLATWKHGFQGGCPERSAILTESQVVQESLSIPGTGLHLVYHSSRALGYESTIQLQLTPSEIPETLRRIYLRITIEGILFEKTFEADPDIKFTYAWNRLNVYRQRVYGVTWAVVKVGFAYSNCDQVIWDAQTTQVSGHDMSISDIGGWDLSIHHRYNFHEGILQKGDGRNMHLKQKPRVLMTLMGDGHQREVSCRSCDGPADKQRLLTSAALAPGPDGSLYIADFNLIRRVMPDNTVRTVVRLNETRVSYRYHMAVSPVTGEVYISDHEAHLILKVRDPDDFSRPEDNYMPYVGSGERCFPGDEVGCGDGSLARDAKLQYPKGMAVSLDDVLYFADGTNVRAVDADGIINTVIGTHRHRAHWRPLPCEGTVPVSEVSLRWPTALAVSPLDDSLYVLDDHHVLRLTRDGQIKVVAGRPLHCPPLSHDAPSDLAAHTTLRSPQSLAFAPNGDLYIAESDNERVNRVRVIETDERIHDFAGADSKCNCQEEACPCFDEAHVLAATAVFSTISALAVTPDGVVHVLDQGNLRIRSVTSSIPEPNAERLYEIYSPETQEVYVFNRFGHHTATRSIPTRRTIYSFAYNVNTSNGKLSTVTDAGGNRVSFLRDYTGHVSMVENSRQQKCRLQMSRSRRLEFFVTPDEHNVTLTYHGATGLLRSRMDSTGRAHVYTYDTYGRLTRAVTPSGQVIDLAFDLSQKGARVTLTRDGTAPITMLIKGALVTETIGSASSVTAQLPDGSVVTRTAWGHHIATETVPYTLLQDHTLAHSYPVSGRQRTEIGNELVNSFDWKYFVEAGDRQGPVTQVGRKMRVNGEDLLTFKYDLFTGTEAVLNEVGATLLNVTYDPLGRPLKWTPAQPFLPVQLKYNRFGQLEEWTWGDMREQYSYDRAGRYEGVTYADGTRVMYSFKDLSSVKPYKVSVASGSEHLLEHDEGGALSAVTTPRGHKYTFHVQPSLLHNRFSFTPPGSPRHPYQLFYSDDGKILAEVLPHQASRVIYHHDNTGRMHLQIFGDGSVEYGYHPETGLIRTVSVRERGFELRSDNKYHGGLVKEQRIRYGSTAVLDSAKLRFLYDGNARPRRVEVEINGKEQPDYDMKYNIILGTLDSVGDMKVTSSYHNKTVIQDVRKIMLRVTEFDPHGRVVESALTVRSRLVYRNRYGYDTRGRLATMSTWRGPGTDEKRTNYTYTPDGFLQAVDGADSWQFRYDANGNMIAVVEGGREMTATYDGADRLVGWGDVELNTYSPGGAVVRQGEVHLSYSARGNLKSAWQQGQYKVWCRHDHHGRLAVWEDDHGNVTQFFYADLRRPDLPTHIHYPKRGVTHALEYDERGHLMAIHTGKRRLWIATDHLGSPVAVFDDSGVLVKEVVRSPWGATLTDSRPDLLLHVDFQGGLRDPVTGFIVFGLHTYDPVHAMWMAPRYDLVTSAPDHVGAVYVHRFHDNDPVNPVNRHPNHYTDLNSWLKLYGVDLSRMLGSSYHDETVERQEGGLLQARQLAPSLRVISGLSCSTEGVLRQFSQPSLLPESLIRSDAPAWAIPGWDALGRFMSSPPMLGPGVMVSRVEGRAVVTLVPSRENSVVQDVARDVLNGSALLDVTLTHHRHHTLYLAKENAALRQDDLQQLQRLSGRFNVTSRDEGEHHEIRVVGNDVSLVLMYGTDAPNARHRLLRHAHRHAVTRAWEMERLLAERGSPTRHEWTVEERGELVSKGSVSGYIAADIHSIHRFPLLADDPTNVVFRRDTGRRRRRSRDAPHS